MLVDPDDHSAEKWMRLGTAHVGNPYHYAGITVGIGCGWPEPRWHRDAFALWDAIEQTPPHASDAYKMRVREAVEALGTPAAILAALRHR